MTEWSAVDAYFAEALTPLDAALRGALDASEAGGLPPIAVSQNQGKMLQIFAQMVGAKRILEIGTLGGFSTICLARALPPGGELVTIEYEQKHADVARKNIAAAGLADRVTVHVGAALDVLPSVKGPFDFTFIDADKANNPGYVDHAIRLARPGAIIVVDNVVREGRVLDQPGDANVQGIRRMTETLAKDARVESCAIQTVGDKGWDGFALIRVK